VATKRKMKRERGYQTGTVAAKGDMPGGEMDRPFKEGLMEMPTGGGGDMPAGSGAAPGTSGGRMTNTRANLEGSGLMPGESACMPSDVQESGMPGGGMNST